MQIWNTLKKMTVRTFKMLCNVKLENNKNDTFSLEDEDEFLEANNQNHDSLKGKIEKPESSNAFTTKKNHFKIVCK